jgi:hypothetical protein
MNAVIFICDDLKFAAKAVSTSAQVEGVAGKCLVAEEWSDD